MNRIFIFLVIVSLCSCKLQQDEGMWISKNFENHSFDIVSINDNQAKVRILASWNYWLSDSVFQLNKTSNHVFENDSLKLQLIDSSGLFAKFFRDDVLVDHQMLHQLKKFNMAKQKNKVLSMIVNKTLFLDNEKQKDSIDIIGDQYSYKYSKEGNQQIEYFDLMSFETELFLLTNTSNFYPIQITSIKSNSIFGIVHTFEDAYDQNIEIRERKELPLNLKGRWIANVGPQNNFEISLSSDYLIEYNNQIDSVEIEILSEPNNILVLHETAREPYILEVKVISQDSIEIKDNRRSRRRNKPIKYKRKAGGI